MSDELPKGWTLPTLKDFTKVEWGNTNITKKSYTSSGFPAFSAAGKDGFLPTHEWEGPAVILSAIGARCGKCFMASGKWTAIKNTIVIQGDPNVVDHTLLFHYLNDASRWEISGSGQPFITMGSANKLQFPFPPLPEQKRIVMKLAKVLEKVDTCQKRLAKIPILLKRFRQSVLAAACSGRLTADWREKSNPISMQSDWGISKVESVATIGSGNTSKEIISTCKKKGDIPWYRVGDMNLPGNETEMIAGTNFLSHKDAEQLRVRVYPVGTIIFPKRGGAIATNKKRRLTKPSAIDLNTMALTPFGCNADFFWMWFTTINLGALADGSSVPQINNTDILPLEIPLPSKEEQSEITKRTNELLNLADQIEVCYRNGQAHVDKLTQSILAKAFRGDLVPQDPNDESASVLLEKIRAKDHQAEKTHSNGKRSQKI